MSEKYCPECEAVLIQRFNANQQKHFLGCSKYPGCTYTEPTAGPGVTPFQPPAATDDTIINELRSIQQNIDSANTYLESLAKIFNTVGPEMEKLAMAAAIPGFGKLADELTDDERAQRADYFTKRCETLQIGMPLPYDKRQRGDLDS